VQQKAAQEFIERQGHEFLFVVVSGVAPAKGDLLFGKRDQAVVGDGYGVGVAAQILEHILGATERWFRVDHCEENRRERRRRNFCRNLVNVACTSSRFVLDAPGWPSNVESSEVATSQPLARYVAFVSAFNVD
jgi:hypothetical protein